MGFDQLWSSRLMPSRLLQYSRFLLKLPEESCPESYADAQSRKEETTGTDLYGWKDKLTVSTENQKNFAPLRLRVSFFFDLGMPGDEM